MVGIFFYLQKPESMRQVVTRCREDEEEPVPFVWGGIGGWGQTVEQARSANKNIYIYISMKI